MNLIPPNNLHQLVAFVRVAFPALRREVSNMRQEIKELKSLLSNFKEKDSKNDTK